MSTAALPRMTAYWLEPAAAGLLMVLGRLTAVGQSPFQWVFDLVVCLGAAGSYRFPRGLG